MPTILILLPRRVKIIRALLTSRSSRAPSYLTSIAHLPRNVTTSSELSRRSLFACSAHTANSRITRHRTYPSIYSRNFASPNFCRADHDSNATSVTWFEFHLVSGARVCVTRICLPFAKIPKIDRANSERERIAAKSTNDLHSDLD